MVYNLWHQKSSTRYYNYDDRIQPNDKQYFMLKQSNFIYLFIYFVLWIRFKFKNQYCGHAIVQYYFLILILGSYRFAYTFTIKSIYNHRFSLKRIYFGPQLALKCYPGSLLAEPTRNSLITLLLIGFDWQNTITFNRVFRMN